MEPTGKALVEHWNWAATKGLMNKNTASGLRSACSQVLGILDDWETVDVKSLDIETTLTKFQNLKAKEFKPQVLETYKRRFRQAIQSYVAYLRDPGSWKPRTVERQARVADNGRKGTATTEQPRVAGHEFPSTGTVEYPFPLREDLNVRLILPRDLKKAEVKRLTLFMAALAVDSEDERGDWARLSFRALNKAYSEQEPEYSLDALKERNPEYEGR
jgi:hypothetical protein